MLAAASPSLHQLQYVIQPSILFACPSPAKHNRIPCMVIPSSEPTFSSLSPPDRQPACQQTAYEVAAGIRVSCRFAGRVCVLPPTRPQSTSQVDTRPIPLGRLDAFLTCPVRLLFARPQVSHHIPASSVPSRTMHMLARLTGWLAGCRKGCRRHKKTPSTERLNRPFLSAFLYVGTPATYMYCANKAEISLAHHIFNLPSFVLLPSFAPRIESAATCASLLL
ncbi:hypothetical protein V8C26DRAFT_26715 [Trichoderma gracile]